MRALLSFLLVLGTFMPLPAAEPITMVACAPGYPGTTEQAQPTMDDFARSVAEAAGWAPQRLRAVYHERLDTGLERLSAADAALAMVPLAFYLEYREALELVPLLEVVQAAGSKEVWTLVARKGTVDGPAALDGWRIVGMPGYSPRFVRRIALGRFGALPAGVEIDFSGRVLSALRAAAAGEPVAVLLDSAQFAALSSLPYAAELESVGSSPEIVASVVCRVGRRLSPEDQQALTRAMLGLGGAESGREILDALRVTRFLPLDEEALEGLEGTFESSPPEAP